MELNKDYYACFDVQAYKCKPQVTIDKNPLQYVLSFNPPLMLTNYCLEPLELFEIDNPGLPNEVSKCTTRIPPSMSSFLIELDLSHENESTIKVNIID